MTVKTARENVTRWSVTFPVGTGVSGVIGLVLHIGSLAFHVMAVLLFAGLVVTWIIARLHVPWQLYTWILEMSYVSRGFA